MVVNFHDIIKKKLELGLNSSQFEGQIKAMYRIKNDHQDVDCSSPIKCNFAFYYICKNLLIMCKYGDVSHDKIDFSQQAWYAKLNNFSKSLLKDFFSLLSSSVAVNAQGSNVHFGVKGLQILAIFSEDFLLNSMMIAYEAYVQHMLHSNRI